MELEPNAQNLRHTNQAMMKNPDFFIPKPTFDLLKEMMPAEQFKEFLTKKLALEKASKSSLKTTSNTHEGRPNENIPPVAPRQYQKSATANLALLEESGSEDSDESDDENQELKQARAAMATLSGLYRSACMVRRAQIGTTGSTTLVNTTKYHRLIFDTGADTCVVGKGWDGTHVYGLPISMIQLMLERKI